MKNNPDQDSHLKQGISNKYQNNNLLINLKRIIKLSCLN